MRVVFMGTPAFSVPALHAIHAAGHEILRVYTRPPAASGRGLKQTPSPVQSAADALGLEKALEMGLTVTDASDAERAFFKEATSGIEADVLSEIDARGVDGAAALSFFKSKL